MTPRTATLTTSYSVILAVSSTHLINDLIQFLLPALYPLLKAQYAELLPTGSAHAGAANHRLRFATPPLRALRGLAPPSLIPLQFRSPL